MKMESSFNDRYYLELVKSYNQQQWKFIMNINDNPKLNCLQNIGQMVKLLSIQSADISDYLRKVTKIPELSDGDVDEFCRLVLLSQDDLDRREQLRKLFEEILRYRSFFCKVYMFGSSVNGVGFRDSDADLYIQLLHPHSKQPIQIAELPNLKSKLKQFSDIYNRMLRGLYRSIVINAKICPIIKLIKLPKLLNVDVLSFDLNITHSIGVFNSVFVKLLTEENSKILQLMTILKFWAKSNEIVHQLCFNSYAFVMLIVFFLQNCDSSIISASLEMVQESAKQYQDMIVDDKFHTIIREHCRTIVNQEAIAKADIFKLIQQFFTFYSKFDFYNYVICPHIGTAVRKDLYEKQISKLDSTDAQSKFDFSSIISLVDPFEMNRNITSQVKVHKFDNFVILCKRYSRMPESFFRNGANFRLLILPKSSSSSGPNSNGKFATLKPTVISGPPSKPLLLEPTVCFIQNFLNQHFNSFGTIFESLNRSQLTKLLAIDYLQTFVDSFAEFISKKHRHGNFVIYLTKRSLMKNNLLDLNSDELINFPGDAKSIDLALVTVNLARITKLQGTSLPLAKISRNSSENNNNTAGETNDDDFDELDNTDCGDPTTNNNNNNNNNQKHHSKLNFVSINVIIQCVFRSEHFFYLGYQIDNPLGKVAIRKLFNQIRTQLCTCESVRDVAKCTSQSQ